MFGPISNFFFTPEKIKVTIGGSETTITKIIGKNDATMWITHINKPDSGCNIMSSMESIHPALNWFNIERHGEILYEEGDAKTKFLAIIRFIR